MTLSMPTPTSSASTVPASVVLEMSSPRHNDHFPLEPDTIFDSGCSSDSESEIGFPTFVHPIFLPPSAADDALDLHMHPRERLEWHSMMVTVLLGDVLNQEKNRLKGGIRNDEEGRNLFITELWLVGLSRYHGRAPGSQMRMVNECKRGAKGVVQDVIDFRVSEGDSDDGNGLDAAEQISNLLDQVDVMRNSWPTGKSMIEDVPRVASPEFTSMESALVAWYNVSTAIEFQVGVLRELINDEIDVARAVEEVRPWEELSSKSMDLQANTPGSQPGASAEQGSSSITGQTFTERVLMDPSLAVLWKPPHQGLIIRLDGLVIKAKDTLVRHGQTYEKRHIPSFIEDVQTLINFPSRLMKTLIEFRIQHARSELQDPAGEGLGQTEKALRDFHQLLKLAAEVKETYLNIVRPLDGWKLPDCIEEGYDSTFLEGLRFYFTMINWKLAANKNADKETEILKEEWKRIKRLGKHFESGAIEVALQFCIVTSKCLCRLTKVFVKDICEGDYSEKTRSDGRESIRGGARAEKEKHFKLLLAGIRTRQRTITRFVQDHDDRLGNSAEYLIGDAGESLNNQNNDENEDDRDEGASGPNELPPGLDGVGKPVEWILQVLAESRHTLIEFVSDDQSDEDIIVIASPDLFDPNKVVAIINLVLPTKRLFDDPTYVLVLRPPSPSSELLASLWRGARMTVTCAQPRFDILPSRLRLISNGRKRALATVKTQLQSIVRLRVAVHRRPNNPLLYTKLEKLKNRIAILSQTIVQSVGIIRNRAAGMSGGDELVHRSFEFAAEFGGRSMKQMRGEDREAASKRLMVLAVEWLGFLCRDCDPSVGRTFRWAVQALEFMASMMGNHVLQLSEEAFGTVQKQVAQCMSLLVSHFDIMGARSFEQRRRLAADERENSDKRVKERRAKLAELDEKVRSGGLFGRVLDPNNEADRALALLSSAGGHIGIKWQQGAFLGGGTFGTVYAARDLETGEVLAVKEIRLPDPLLIPFVIGQIRDEVKTLQRLRHPYVVQYLGIEPHRDKVCIFMEYCPGGSLAGLLQYGPIEDEVVVQLYTHMMLEGLAYLHGQGVAHRDLKPQNILLTEDGSIKFVDFGTAKSIARTAADLASKGIEEVQQIDPRLLTELETMDVEDLMGFAPEMIYAAFSVHARDKRKNTAATTAPSGSHTTPESDESSEFDVGTGEDGELDGDLDGPDSHARMVARLGAMSGMSDLGKDIMALALSALSPELAGTPLYLPPEALLTRGFPFKRTQTLEVSEASPDGVTAAGDGPGGQNGSDRSTGAGSNTVTSPVVQSQKAPPTAGDIWALGCVIVEMCTGERPWIELDNECAILYSISRGLTPVYPPPGRLSDLGRQFLDLCFEAEPRKRSTADTLLRNEWVTEVGGIAPKADGNPGLEPAVGDRVAEDATINADVAAAGGDHGPDGGGIKTPVRSVSAPPSAVPSPSLRNAELAALRQTPELIKRSISAPTSPRLIAEVGVDPMVPVFVIDPAGTPDFEGIRELLVPIAEPGEDESHMVGSVHSFDHPLPGSTDLDVASEPAPKQGQEKDRTGSKRSNSTSHRFQPSTSSQGPGSRTGGQASSARPEHLKPTDRRKSDRDRERPARVDFATPTKPERPIRREREKDTRPVRPRTGSAVNPGNPSAHTSRSKDRDRDRRKHPTRPAGGSTSGFHTVPQHGPSQTLPDDHVQRTGARPAQGPSYPVRSHTYGPGQMPHPVPSGPGPELGSVQGIAPGSTSLSAPPASLAPYSHYVPVQYVYRSPHHPSHAVPVTGYYQHPAMRTHRSDHRFHPETPTFHPSPYSTGHRPQYPNSPPGPIPARPGLHRESQMTGPSIYDIGSPMATVPIGPDGNPSLSPVPGSASVLRPHPVSQMMSGPVAPFGYEYSAVPARVGPGVPRGNENEMPGTMADGFGPAPAHLQQQQHPHSHLHPQSQSYPQQQQQHQQHQQPGKPGPKARSGTWPTRPGAGPNRRTGPQ